MTRAVKKFLTLTLLGGTLMAAGCSSHQVAGYSSDAGHVSKLRDWGNQSVYLTEFKTGANVAGSSMCRMEGKIELPRNQTWSGYVHNALKSELQLAQRSANSADGGMRVQGTLKKAEFNSMDGTWVLALSLTFPDGTTASEAITYDFDPSFVATQACQAVADAYAPAVQKLIGTLLKNPTVQEKLKTEADKTV